MEKQSIPKYSLKDVEGLIVFYPTDKFLAHVKSGYDVKDYSVFYYEK